MRAAPAIVRALGALLAIGVSAGCKVNTESFHQKVWSCNPNAADPACGTDLDENPMACVPAYQLGGRNFCATACDATKEPTETPEGAAMCLPSGPKTTPTLSGARLPRCNPAAQGNTCGNEELSCLRTDLLKDEGVCMTINSCQADSDCRDPVRAKCMGVLLRDTYAKAELRADHTYCLQYDCRERRTACSPGETCLRDVIPKSSNPSDICVPNCDANGNCPPNYFCYPDIYSKASPPVCIPGLLGLRCRSRTDCLFGECVETGAKFKVCSVQCKTDDDCAKFDSEHGTFVCNGEGWCAGPRAFRGSQCDTDADCLYEGEKCSRITTTSRYGLCLQTCPALGTCQGYGGIPHVCRPQVDADNKLDLKSHWVCWPGYFGQLCGEKSQCMAGLDCKQADPTQPLLKICTNSCASDADCANNRFTKEGWCHPQLQMCLSPYPDDDTRCERDVQCESKKCIPDPMNPGKKKCDKTPGY